MSNYSEFASVYDRLMSDVDYRKRSAYLCRLFKKQDRMPALLLDVACGTGGFSNEFAKIGVEVIGADASEEMLTAARENSERLGTDVLFLHQKAQELDLYGTVDGAVCCLDSINHITDYGDFCRALNRISLFLEKDRLFIFDVNTVYKHKEILGDNTFVLEQNGVFCVWQNSFYEEDLTTEISLDFFIESGGLYERKSEDFCERAYTDEEIQKALRAAGFEVQAVYADMTEGPPKADTDRAIYVARKME